jgi:hypothetical protein
MTIKNVAGIMLALALSLCSMSAMAVHNYKSDFISYTGIEAANIAIEAISKGNLFKASNVDSKLTGAMLEFYEGTEVLSDENGLESFTKNKSLYVARQKAAGEVCAAVWRYRNNKPAKTKYGYAEKSYNETTPFFDRNNSFYNEMVVSATSRGVKTVIKMFGDGVWNSDNKDYRFGIHRLGLLSSKSSTSNNSLVFTIFEYHYLKNSDGEYKPMTDITNDGKAAVSFLLTAQSYDDIKKFRSEKVAYNTCHDTILVPLLVK